MDSNQIILKKEDRDTSYALKNGNPVHISNAPTGTIGYSCLGCGFELRPYHQFKNPHHKDYFAHHGIKKPEDKCYLGNETLRHNHAKRELQINKRIKLPAIYRFGENDSDPPMKLSDSKFITAASAKVEMQFHKLHTGEVIVGKTGEQSISFTVKPDVTFFDEKGNPFLFIEIRAEHKCGPKKIAKLQVLGIDTIEITIPQMELEKIPSLFQKTSHTIWLHNNLSSEAKYVRPHRQSITKEGNTITSELQRRLFQESFACRKHRIKIALQGINELLRQTEFKGREHKIERDQKREKKLLRQENGDLELLEKEYNRTKKDIRRQVENTHGPGHSNLEENFRREESEIKTRHGNLESRYHSKANELDQRQTDLYKEHSISKGKHQLLLEHIQKNTNRLSFLKNRNQGYESLSNDYSKGVRRQIESKQSEIIKVERAIEKLRNEEHGILNDIRFLEQEEKRLRKEIGDIEGRLGIG